MSGVLALVATRDLDRPAATEFLRVLAAARAVGLRVDLREIGEARGALRGDPTLEADGERYLAALVEDGVAPGDERDLAGAIAQAQCLLVLPPPGRPAAPLLLRLERGRRPSRADVEAIPRAGQVVLG